MIKEKFSALTSRMKSDGDGPKIKKFGWFGGVFTPNVLTILGVIMYLRLGWVVGNAGLLGAIIIILMAKTVTICTGMSMSSITTNIRIGAGGAYSIISKSLGLEAGGSIGVPLYIAQTLSAALYIIGFTEGWLRVFPGHTPIVVSTIAWAILLTVSYISADLAIKVQFVIMAIMGISIVSFIFTPSPRVPQIEYVGEFERASFWVTYAIFFPAVTGIMAGANMSGDLKDPRRAIPWGTMGSIIVTMIIYILMAIVAASIATPEELLDNQMIMVDKAFWGGVVLAGIMGATLSSALGSMLGAPRLLQALAEQKTVPLHKIFAAKTVTNEPRNATIITGVFIEIALVLGNLDALAVLITMFFLITYGMLNLVVFLQQSMKIISFRPTFKVPRFVSFFGAASCIFMMFLINPIFSVVAISIIIIIYIWLARKGLEADFGDIRGGLFITLAERAARMADQFPEHQISWKPDLLVPIKDPKVWAGPLLFIRNITYPSGSLFAFTVKGPGESVDENQTALNELLLPLKHQSILTSATVIEDSEFLHGAKLVIQTLRGGAFRPNTLFLTLGGEWGNGQNNRNNSSLRHKLGQELRGRVFGPTKKEDTLNQLLSVASKYGMGIILLRQHPRMAFGVQKDVNLWLRDKSPNWHLAILIALQLQMNWGGKINLVTVASNGEDKFHLQEFLERLTDQARLPSTTELHVLPGPFRAALTKAPRADINIFGLSLVDEKLPLEFVRDMPELVKTSCVFVIDSGKESALV